jgi:hypothetical protein
MSNEEKLAERFPSMRDVWPPHTVTAKVDEQRAEEAPEVTLVSARLAEPGPHDETNVMRVGPLVALKAAVHDLDLARVEARRCRAATLEARVALAKALENWNRTMPVMTQEQQARAFCATSQADRARRAAAGLLPYRPTVTATARAMAGGNAKRGGGTAYRRGPGGVQAFTKAEALTLEANRLRIAAAAAKPPGQR